jgi:hypothetical protein
MGFWKSCPIMLIAASAFLSCALAEQQKPVWPSTKDLFTSKLMLGRTLEFYPRRLATGAPRDHDCIRGNYSHRYEAGNEVWLCCVPIEELERDSFRCASESVSSLFADTLYMKVRFCSLLHPTSADQTLIPVCVPAPLVAPTEE